MTILFLLCQYGVWSVDWCGGKSNLSKVLHPFFWKDVNDSKDILMLQKISISVFFFFTFYLSKKVIIFHDISVFYSIFDQTNTAWESIRDFLKTFDKIVIYHIFTYYNNI